MKTGLQDRLRGLATRPSGTRHRADDRLKQLSVPALPHGRRSVRDRVLPRGVVRAHEQLVRRRQVARVGERWQQEASDWIPVVSAPPFDSIDARSCRAHCWRSFPGRGRLPRPLPMTFGRRLCLAQADRPNSSANAVRSCSARSIQRVGSRPRSAAIRAMTIASSAQYAVASRSWTVDPRGPASRRSCGAARVAGSDSGWRLRANP